MVRVSPQSLLAALGVPPEVHKQLSSREIAQLHAFLRMIEPMGARRNGQFLEQHMCEYDAGQIRNIQAPALVLHAPDDMLVAFEQSIFAAGHIPGAQLFPMERGGHLALMMDANRGAIETVRMFLKQHNSW